MAKGGAVAGNTSPVGEINREVVGPPIATPVDGDYVVPQTFRLAYNWLASSSPVFRMENPHDVPMEIVDIFTRVTTAPSAGASSGILRWSLVASSSAVGGAALGENLGQWTSSVGTVRHFPGSSGFTPLKPSNLITWEKFGNSSGAWITAQIGPASQGALMKSSSAAAQAYVTAIPLYS